MQAEGDVTGEIPDEVSAGCRDATRSTLVEMDVQAVAGMMTVEEGLRGAVVSGREILAWRRGLMTS